jgi:hypothetical protein
MAGNMRSRFTNFLSEDGEKTWRNRDLEFESGNESTQLLSDKWEEGWLYLFSSLRNLNESDLETIVFIRNMGHSALEAIFRQLAQYSYHVGQMVFIGKMLRGPHWKNLSIPKGQSQLYNDKLFGQPKGRKHFTDDLLNPE